MRGTKANACNLLSIHSEEHESRVKVFLLPKLLEAFQALLGGLLYISKVVTEGITLGTISSFGIHSGAIGTNDDACRKFGFWHGRIHLNQHLVGTADVTIP